MCTLPLEPPEGCSPHPPVVFPQPHFASYEELKAGKLAPWAMEDRDAICPLFAETMPVETICHDRAWKQGGCGHAHPCILCSKTYPPAHSYLIWHAGPLCHAGPIRYLEHDGEGDGHIYYYQTSLVFNVTSGYLGVPDHCPYIVRREKARHLWSSYHFYTAMAVWSESFGDNAASYLSWLPEEVMEDIRTTMKVHAIQHKDEGVDRRPFQGGFPTYIKNGIANTTDRRSAKHMGHRNGVPFVRLYDLQEHLLHNPHPPFRTLLKHMRRLLHCPHSGSSSYTCKRKGPRHSFPSRKTLALSLV